MIELGKYGSTFYVTGKDNFVHIYSPYESKITDDFQVGDYTTYKEFAVMIVSINDHTYGLQLVSNDQEDSIPIVI